MVPNAVVLIDGGASAVIPGSMDGGLASSTPTCIAVGATSPDDGSTTIRLTAAEKDRATDVGLLVFDGSIETPDGVVFIRSVEGAVYLSLGVGASRTRLRVLVDHPQEPSRIEVVAGGVIGAR